MQGVGYGFAVVTRRLRAGLGFAAVVRVFGLRVRLGFSGGVQPVIDGG